MQPVSQPCNRHSKPRCSVAQLSSTALFAIAVEAGRFFLHKHHDRLAMTGQRRRPFSAPRLPPVRGPANDAGARTRPLTRSAASGGGRKNLSGLCNMVQPGLIIPSLAGSWACRMKPGHTGGVTLVGTPGGFCRAVRLTTRHIMRRRAFFLKNVKKLQYLVGLVVEKPPRS